MFGHTLNLPHNPREARAVAGALDGLAVALRTWSPETWTQIQAQDASVSPEELTERLVRLAAPLALDRRRRQEMLRSAEATADVLRCLWPVQSDADGDLRDVALPANERLLAGSVAQ